MLVQYTKSEGDMWICVEVRALDLIDCYKTGVLETINAGTFKVAAVMQEAGCMVYDFVLKGLGLCPTRFVSNPMANKCMWAW